MLHPLLLPAFLVDHPRLLRVYQPILLLLLRAGPRLLLQLLPSLVLLFLLEEDFPHPLLEVPELVAADGFVVFEACGVEL